MPLLKKKTLEKTQVDEFLRDDEEVFHCVMTNEIFREYDEFAERTILCNSMVWTCSMSGKTNLTYEEALQSEQNAQQMLNEFPLQLHIPILYIATCVKGSFSDMVEDVCAFVKEHFFIGEEIEACFSKTWSDYKVINVVAPSEKQIMDHKSKPNRTDVYKLYNYEVIAINSNMQETLTASFSQMRRKYGSYSREKCKLFLKQHVESQGSVIGIKKLALEIYKMDGMKFDQIFSGPAPTFEHRSKSGAAGAKKVRQETLAKFLSKNNIIVTAPKDDDVAEVAKKQNQRVLDLERKQQERELRKQRDLEIGIKLRDWNLPMDDLLLEDHKVLPVPKPIASKIPDKYIGDVLCIMEFIHSFSSVLNARQYFTGGVAFHTMERILFDDKVSSPMSLMIEMFLTALFKLEASERENYNRNVGARWGASKQTLASDRCQLWLLKNYGGCLFNIEMDICALTELLRLHLLSSGNNVNEVAIKWRSQYRGGFESEEDPAITFRVRNPHILRQLSLYHVCQLSVVDKLKLLDCLVNQLLTYKEIRDSIDQNLEDMKEQRIKLRAAHANERKRQVDADSHIAQLKRESVTLLSGQSKTKLEEAMREDEEFKTKYEEQITILKKKLFHSLNFMGYDRAHRAYFKLLSVPAIVVNQEDHQQGACIPEITQHVPELVGADKKDIKNYIKKVADQMNSSDKENEPKQNGIESKNSTSLDKINELLMCSTDPTACVVHTISRNTCSWSIIESVEQLEDLQNCLNKRGINEKELAKFIETNFQSLEKHIGRTPNLTDVARLALPSTRFLKDDNWGYPEDYSANDVMRLTVIERILELEEKLFDGYLGGISKDREDFRQLVEDNKYERIDDLTRPRTKWQIDEDEEEAKQFAPSDWEDPGKYLEQNIPDVDSDDSELESDEILMVQTNTDEKSITFLAYALAQVALSVKLNFISKPLGQFNLNPKQNKARQNVIILWEQSLLNSTSYSQLLLHCHVLDSHIAWSKSTLVVKCKTCKRGTNEQNILLCDYCNDGYHIYCLRPKLSAVPEGNWYCVNCKQKVENDEARKKQKLEDEAKKKQKENMEVGFGEEPTTCFVCGAEETDDSLQCVTCLKMYHLECTNLKRAVRGAWTCMQCKESSEREATQASHAEHQRRSGRSNDPSVDLPLNNAALQELLRDVIAHDDGWPFIKPVHKNEVPDYYDIIKKPMDFGTIKYKLNMGDYQYDDEVLSDCQLVFENCHTYNSSGDEVYQCGSKLLKYFTKKIKDLKLDFEVTVTMEMNGIHEDENHDGGPPRKSRRMK